MSELTPAHFSHTSAPTNTVPTSHELWIPWPILPFTGCISPPLFCLSIGNLNRPIPIFAFMDLIRKSWLLVVLQPVRAYNGSYSLNRGAPGMLRQGCTIICPLDMTHALRKHSPDKNSFHTGILVTSGLHFPELGSHEYTGTNWSDEKARLAAETSPKNCGVFWFTFVDCKEISWSGVK